ncbi:hypothetical protein I4F81_001257 [Pyropia yezoensis]|uniref:Uncharacterized protein n=1 Tax=Pyropia yezoensis TaxID=2788 RepID=A0ACC3BLP6_PYRYE|nr:hypothetical protein I4F81_001257 [Neopyropia yezoensis]
MFAATFAARKIRDALPSMTQAYDRSTFGVEPPREPADDGSLLLAVIVVLPELVALIVLLLSTQTWRMRDIWVLLFVFLSGCVSMAGIVVLAVWEAQGDGGIAAAVRTESSSWDGRRSYPFVLRAETLFLCTRTGYRPGLVRGIAIGMAVTYVATSAAVSGAVWALRRHGSEQQEGRLGDDDDGDDAAAANYMEGVWAGGRRHHRGTPLAAAASAEQRPRTFPALRLRAGVWQRRRGAPHSSPPIDSGATIPSTAGPRRRRCHRRPGHRRPCRGRSGHHGRTARCGAGRSSPRGRCRCRRRRR